jgi:hypothetical protein
MPMEYDTLGAMRAYATTSQRYRGLAAALKDLDSFVGLETVKESVASQIQSYISRDLAEDAKRLDVRTRSYTKKATQSKRAKRRKRSHGWSRKKRKHLPPASSEAEAEAEAGSEAGDDDTGGGSRRVTREIKVFSEAILQSLMAGGGDDGESDDSDFVLDEDVEDNVVSCRPAFARTMNLHTLLLGKPGTGKTTLARVLGRVWSSLGLVLPGRFCTVTRGDLVAKYQGHSTAKVRKLIRKYQNGVIFVDEAYALISGGEDNFGNEVMGEIVECMTNPNSHVVFIMAGYEKAIRSSLLGTNEGLERRFGSIHIMKAPNTASLCKIFRNMAKSDGWVVNVPPRELRALFERSADCLKFGGGDVEELLRAVQRAHIRAVWPSPLTRRIDALEMGKGMAGFRKTKGRSKATEMSHLYM